MSNISWSCSCKLLLEPMTLFAYFSNFFTTQCSDITALAGPLYRTAQIKMQPFPIPIFHSIDRKCTSFTSNIWLPKPHPVQSNTFELMDVCFSTSSQLFNTEFCECKQKEFILVQKCTSKEEREDFYVYRLFPALSDKKTSSDSLNRCELRYCADIKPGCVSFLFLV